MQGPNVSESDILYGCWYALWYISKSSQCG